MEAKVIRIGAKYCTSRLEKRIDLYVASPEVFWKTVRQEAEKIAEVFMSK